MDLTVDQYNQLSHIVHKAVSKWGPVRQQDLDDLTHDVLLAVLVSKETIRSPDRLPAIVYRAAQNTWLNRCRSRSNYTAFLDRYREVMSRLAQPPDNDADLEALQAAVRELARSEPRAAEALHHRFWLGESFAAIGAALGISNCAAHNLVSRALNKLASSPRCDGIAGATPDRRRMPDQKNRARKKLAIVAQWGIQTASAAAPAAPSLNERGQSWPRA